MRQNGNVAYTPEYVESLKEGQVFVFGSNLVGCHSGGASLIALQRFGAVWGQAEGPQGRCYAIPVDIRGEAVDNVTMYMKRHIDKFLAYAKTHKDQFFVVIRVGCGSAGFDEEFMAPFFKDALMMKNVSLPKSFVDILRNNLDEEKKGTIQRVFNLIILDESGSMSAIRQQAISGLNETFQTISNAQKEHREQQHFISFVTFNSTRIRTVMNRQVVDDNKRMKWSDYCPKNCTPLFDAMGHSLNDLKNYVGVDDVVLVTIITDGYENTSKEYSRRAIKDLVAELKGKGWVFVYIGTNQDVDAVADDMGIRSRRSYEYSDRGASDMFETELSSKELFFRRLHREGRQFMMEDNYDYFSPDDSIDKEPEKEPDITWNMDDVKQSSSTCVDNQDENNLEKENQQEESAKKEVDNIEPENPLGFWGKIKNYILG